MNQQLKTPLQEDEISLGEFFDLTSKMFLKIFQAIQNSLKKLRHIIIMLILFTVKKYKIFLVFLFGGIGIQFLFSYQANKMNLSLFSSQSIYNASLSIIPKHGLAKQLETNLSYYNNLIANGEFKKLANILNVSDNISQTLKQFSFVINPDTTYGTPLYEVNLTTSSDNSAHKLQDGLINHLSKSNLSLANSLHRQRDLLNQQKLVLQRQMDRLESLNMIDESKESLSNKEKDLSPILVLLKNQNNNNNKIMKEYYDEIEELNNKIFDVEEPILILSAFPEKAQKNIYENLKESILINKILRSVYAFYLFYLIIWIIRYIKNYSEKYEQLTV